MTRAQCQVGQTGSLTNEPTGDSRRGRQKRQYLDDVSMNVRVVGNDWAASGEPARMGGV